MYENVLIFVFLFLFNSLPQKHILSTQGVCLYFMIFLCAELIPKLNNLRPSTMVFSHN